MTAPPLFEITLPIQIPGCANDACCWSKNFRKKLPIDAGHGAFGRELDSRDREAARRLALV
jgi:hypothetical protein